MRISNKLKMYEMFHQGCFGNRTACWTLLDFQSVEKPPTQVALRIANPKGGGENPPHYCVPIRPDEVNDLAKLWVRQQIRPEWIMVSEVAPNENIIWQGEVQFDASGFVHGVYSTHKDLMRKAQLIEWIDMSEKEFLRLSHAMDFASIENLKRLATEFPNHVIELSVYNRSLGLDQHNTIFWEVRDY